MVLAIGSDHAGFELKRELIKSFETRSITLVDEGTYSNESCDYPDYAAKVCKEVLNNHAEFGVLICYTGVGISIAANKFKGIRAALINDKETAKLAREHNNANVICFGAKNITKEEAIECINVFISTEFSNGERHVRRLNKIKGLEEQNER